jgi:alpha-mannosidase
MLGYSCLQLSKKQHVAYRLEIEDMTWSGMLELHPVRKWQVNFVHHTHTDIGYTRSQTDILGDHLRFIDYALDYCDNTDHFPEESQFRWTCEASWAVDEYLRSRPQSQIDRLLKRVKEGRIEITGMYFNFNELPDEQILAASLQPLAVSEIMVLK